MSEINTFSRKSKISIATNPMASVSKINTMRSSGLKSFSRLGMRRKSYGFSAAPGIRPIEKTSQLAMEYKRPLLMYLPTYQLEPTEHFHIEHVSKIVKDTISENFSTHKYHSQSFSHCTGTGFSYGWNRIMDTTQGQCGLMGVNDCRCSQDQQESPALALRLAGDVMRKVKTMGFDRYRIISVVTIGQRRAQSHNNAIAFLWDHERDRYVESNYETSTAFIQIIVFGIYLD